MTAHLGRRAFMSHSAAIIGLAGCNDVREAAPTRPADNILNRPIIDAHAHVFNAKDLPAFEFIHECYIERYAGLALEPLMPLFKSYAESVQAKAPDYAQEIAALHASDAATNRYDATEILSEAFFKLSAGNVTPKPFIVPEPAGQTELFTRLSTKVAAPQSAPPQNLSRVMAERLLTPAPDDRDKALAATLFKGSHGQIRQLLTWFAEFTQYRRARIEAWGTLIEGTGPRFVMPALVDYAYSLARIADTKVPIGQQIRLMGELARRQPTGRLVDGYVAFNPVRHVLDPEHVALMLDDAVDQQGFVGAKIYPPMGFQASGNDTLNMSLFQWRDVDVPDLGAKIEKSLWWLYDYCARKDLTILVHTAPSNSPAGNPYDGVGAEITQANNWTLRPNPKYWAPVLEKYPKLRVNLGHFGGAYDIRHNKEWADSVVGLMRQYPNVYADFADYDLVLDNNSGQLKEKSRLASYLAQRSASDRELLGKRLMFGTDWEMLGLIPEHGQYAPKMLQFLCDSLGGDVDDYASKNALHFIGLNNADSQSRRRLEAFYPRKSGGRETLDAFIEQVSV